MIYQVEHHYIVGTMSFLYIAYIYMYIYYVYIYIYIYFELRFFDSI